MITVTYVRADGMTTVIWRLPDGASHVERYFDHSLFLADVASVGAIITGGVGA